MKTYVYVETGYSGKVLIFEDNKYKEMYKNKELGKIDYREFDLSKLDKNRLIEVYDLKLDSDADKESNLKGYNLNNRFIYNEENIKKILLFNTSDKNNLDILDYRYLTVCGDLWFKEKSKADNKDNIYITVEDNSDNVIAIFKKDLSNDYMLKNNYIFYTSYSKNDKTELEFQSYFEEIFNNFNKVELCNLSCYINGDSKTFVETLLLLLSNFDLLNDEYILWVFETLVEEDLSLLASVCMDFYMIQSDVLIDCYDEKGLITNNLIESCFYFNRMSFLLELLLQGKKNINDLSEKSLTCLIKNTDIEDYRSIITYPEYGTNYIGLINRNILMLLWQYKDDKDMLLDIFSPNKLEDFENLQHLIIKEALNVLNSNSLYIEDFFVSEVKYFIEDIKIEDLVKLKVQNFKQFLICSSLDILLTSIQAGYSYLKIDSLNEIHILDKNIGVYYVYNIESKKIKEETSTKAAYLLDSMYSPTEELNILLNRQNFYYYKNNKRSLLQFLYLLGSLSFINLSEEELRSLEESFNDYTIQIFLNIYMKSSDNLRSFLKISNDYKKIEEDLKYFNIE